MASSQTWRRNLYFTMRFSAAAAAATEATSAELIRIKDDRDLAPAGAVVATVLHYDEGSVVCRRRQNRWRSCERRSSP